MFPKVIYYYIYADKSPISLIIAYPSQISQGVLVPLIPLVPQYYPLPLPPQNPYPCSRGRGLGGKGKGIEKIPQGYPCQSLSIACSKDRISVSETRCSGMEGSAGSVFLAAFLKVSQEMVRFIVDVLLCMRLEGCRRRKRNFLVPTMLL
jgi:hypothetical protein